MEEMKVKKKHGKITLFKTKAMFVLELLSETEEGRRPLFLTLAPGDKESKDWAKRITFSVNLGEIGGLISVLRGTTSEFLAVHKPDGDSKSKDAKTLSFKEGRNSEDKLIFYINLIHKKNGTEEKVSFFLTQEEGIILETILLDCILKMNNF